MRIEREIPTIGRTRYPSAVPGGITLRMTRVSGGRVQEWVDDPPVETPGQAMRAMRRAARAYTVLMPSRSREAAELWAADDEELYAALACLSSRRSYYRTWALRDGQVLALAAIPAGALPDDPAAAEAAPITTPREAGSLMTHQQQAGSPAVRTGEAAADLPAVVGQVVRRGDRVLQVGPGRGALQLAEWTGGQVVAVHTLASAEEARAGLGPRGRADGVVDVRAGDLFEGCPAAGPFNVIVVTGGVSGLAPLWLDQLARGGVIVAPVALGGLHPWVVAGVDRYDRQLYGRVLALDPPGTVRPVDGPLYTGVPSYWTTGADDEALPVPYFVPKWGPVVPPRVTAEQYMDLWLWLAARNKLITAAEPAGCGWGAGAALVAGGSAVYVRPQGLWQTDTAPETMTRAQALVELIQEWAASHRPAHTEMTCRLVQPPGAGPDALLVPEEWATGRPLALPR